MTERLTVSRMRLAILCLLISAVFPSLGRAQAPVFEIEPAHSSIKFHVKASVNISGKFDKWDATLAFTAPEATTGDLEITIKATKFVQTGPETFEVDGNFTIRGVANPEKLTLTVSGNGTGSGAINGKMVFNRKDYGMNKGIPFIRIADHVDVSFHLKEKRVSGPSLALRQ